jgi:hypothetical protein
VRHLNILTEPAWQLGFENRPSFLEVSRIITLKTLVMEKELLDLMKSFEDLVQLDEQGSLGVINKNEVSGWLTDYSKNKPYSGEGCLVYFQYINNKKNNQVMYYACSDLEVESLFVILLINFMTQQGSMKDALTMMGLSQLMLNCGKEDFDLQDWSMGIIIKTYYDAFFKDNRIDDLSHLCTMQEFTAENLMEDMNEIRMRGINTAQFIAEQCLVMMSNE